MSFDERFRARWENVISPGIIDAGLEALRVDASRIGDSILTEILNGIRTSRLIFADISADEGGVRNGNVMYEVGIAHAVRNPQEVVLFRSDGERLLFDLANIRVNRYEPDTDSQMARRRVTEAVSEALREIDLTRNLAVQRAAESLDPDGLILVAEAASGVIRPPESHTMKDVMNNIGTMISLPRLLDLGLIASVYTENEMLFRITPLGSAVSDEVGRTG